MPIYAKLPAELIPNDNSDVLLVDAIDALVAQVKDEQLRVTFVTVVNDALGQLNERLPAGVEVQRVGGGCAQKRQDQAPRASGARLGEEQEDTQLPRSKRLRRCCRHDSKPGTRTQRSHLE